MTKDNLSSAAITDNLETCFIGRRVIYYRQIASTMTEAKQEAQRGVAEGTAVIAGEQTGGRGRIKRAWLSPRGSIALSIILYPDMLYLPLLTMLASLAVVHSIEKVAGLKSQVKWPNDVLISGRKVCGVLVESELRGSLVGYAVIGIGVNVNFRLSDFPEISSIATSLSDELGRDVSRLDMVRSLLVEIERLYLILQAGGSIYEDWRNSLVTLGRRHHFQLEQVQEP